MIENKKIGVVLVNYHSNFNTEKTAKLFNSFECVDNIVIVNNDTRYDGELNYLEEYSKKIKVIYKKENLGYSKGNNIGIKSLISNECKYLIISNSDIFVEENDIVMTIKCIMSDIKIGAAAPRIKDSNNQMIPIRTLNLGYLRIFVRIFISETFLDKVLESILKSDDIYISQSFLPGSLFCCSSKAMIDCDFFDEKIFLYREEEILGKRLKKAGYKEVVLNGIYYKHNHPYCLESAKVKIRRLKIVSESEIYYFKKYLRANVFQIQYVKLMQNLFLITRYIIWTLNDFRRKNIHI